MGRKGKKKKARRKASSLDSATKQDSQDSQPQEPKQEEPKEVGTVAQGHEKRGHVLTEDETDVFQMWLDGNATFIGENFDVSGFNRDHPGMTLMNAFFNTNNEDKELVAVQNHLQSEIKKGQRALLNFFGAKVDAKMRGDALVRCLEVLFASVVTGTQCEIGWSSVLSHAASAAKLSDFINPRLCYVPKEYEANAKVADFVEKVWEFSWEKQSVVKYLYEDTIERCEAHDYYVRDFVEVEPLQKMRRKAAKAFQDAACGREGKMKVIGAKFQAKAFDHTREHVISKPKIQVVSHYYKYQNVTHDVAYVDFAKEQLGGLVFGNGLSQEEVMCYEFPEMMAVVAKHVSEAAQEGHNHKQQRGRSVLWMADDEAIVLKNVTKYLTCNQYMHHNGSRDDIVPADKPVNTTIIALNSLQRKKARQRDFFSKERKMWHFRKAAAAFVTAKAEGIRTIRTGGWGCGQEYGNNLVEMLTVQFIAAAFAGMDKIAFFVPSRPNVMKEILSQLSISSVDELTFEAIVDYVSDLQMDDVPMPPPRVSSPRPSFAPLFSSEKEEEKKVEMEDEKKKKKKNGPTKNSVAPSGLSGIFISYHNDKTAATTAELLQKDLNSNGVKTVVGELTNVAASSQEIAECKLVVVMGTPNYGQAMQYEFLEHLVSKNKRMFLVKMCDRFENSLARFHFLHHTSNFRLNSESGASKPLDSDLISSILNAYNNIP
eukprot:m.72205 g.72205  ORF g.72205 m.72205 type:complete len:712 (-) comp11732_c0_seq4:97-2232(-)